jgi:hypothetical protein
MIQELSLQDKKIILEDILTEWNKYNIEIYICRAICDAAEDRGLITSDDIFNYHYIEELATKLMPEILRYKPENLDNNDNNGWFGMPNQSNKTKIRTKILTKIYTDLNETIGIF